jgi:hypothetical protein
MTNIQIPLVCGENIELFSTTGKMMASTSAVKTFFPLKFMETLGTQNPSIIALKLAGFKTREQQLEKIF